MRPPAEWFSFPYLDVLTARDGRFISHRFSWDNVTFPAELGLMPAAQDAAV